MKRLFTIGDIHEELKKLKNLISQLYISNEDTLVFLGDYVDRGPNSCGVIEFLLRLKDDVNCVFIKGNHDHVFFTDVLYNGNNLHKDNLGFWDYGAKSTLRSYRKAQINPESHLESFYRLLMPYYVIDKRLFIHAGFNRNYLVTAQPDEEIFWWDRELINEAVSKHDDSVSFRLGSSDDFDTIYIGHTPTYHWGKSVPFQWCNVWNLDTGAGKSKAAKLSCMEVNEEMIFQSVY